jgi:translocator protein
MNSYLALGLFVALTSIAAVSGGMYGPGSWYVTLNKPWWTPPGWAFPVVWTTLYIMIAIAGWKAWQDQGVGLLVGLWIVQLVLNAAWSWIMFGQKQIGWALVDAGGMWITIAAFIMAAWGVSHTAALLFIPYLIWVSIAVLLNWSILQLNPGV